MSTVKDLHALAMEHAEQAFAARLRGRAETAAELFAKALRCEVAAIDALHEYSEPTYSILHRSAATLALDCNEVRTAERLAAQALAKNPPDETAQELRDLLFTAIRHGTERRIGVTRPAEEFPPVPQGEPTEIETKPVTVRGLLRYADATRAGNNEIKVIDKEGCPHLVRVPEGMMDDIVRPMWGSIVEIGGRRKDRHIVLDDIKEHKEDQAFERGFTEGGSRT